MNNQLSNKFVVRVKSSTLQILHKGQKGLQSVLYLQGQPVKEILNRIPAEKNKRSFILAHIEKTRGISKYI